MIVEGQKEDLAVFHINLPETIRSPREGQRGPPSLLRFMKKIDVWSLAGCKVAKRRASRKKGKMLRKLSGRREN